MDLPSFLLGMLGGSGLVYWSYNLLGNKLTNNKSPGVSDWLRAGKLARAIYASGFIASFFLVALDERIHSKNAEERNRALEMYSFFRRTLDPEEFSEELYQNLKTDPLLPEYDRVTDTIATRVDSTIFFFLDESRKEIQKTVSEREGK